MDVGLWDDEDMAANVAMPMVVDMNAATADTNTEAAMVVDTNTVVMAIGNKL